MASYHKLQLKVLLLLVRFSQGTGVTVAITGQEENVCSASGTIGSPEVCIDPCAGVVCEEDQNPCTTLVGCVDGECVFEPVADSDGDGACDAIDGCPEDGNKTEPGVCGCGVADLDLDQDQIADCIDDCVGELDALGICNGDCTADADQDGICDDVDDCIGELDAIGVCNGDCVADVNGDGICDNLPSGSGCENWVVYQADISANGFTDIYAVTFDGADANLELIASSEIQVHIAYNEIDNLIYAISGADGSYRTLNPHVENPLFSETTIIDANLSNITVAAFNADGKLLIGSQSSDIIYNVNLVTNEVTIYDGYSPISGGDIAFGFDGRLYLATKDGNGGLYLVQDSGTGFDQLLSTLPGLPTGMALASSNQLLISRTSSSTLILRDIDNGSNVGSFDLKLNGEIFTPFNGDMASGCNTFNDNVGSECDYKLYYTHSGPGAQDGLYELTLNNDETATANFLTSAGSRHIALSPDGTLIYMVGGSNIQTYDVSSNTIINNVSLFNGANDANLSGFVAAVADSDGNVFIGGAGNNVWQVNPATGEATNLAAGISVNGGDLIVAPTGIAGMDELWIITRNNNTFKRVLDPGNGAFSVNVPEINGAAVLENGNVLLANGDGNGEDGYIEVSLVDGSIVGTYDVELPIFNGDLAGGCTSNNLGVDCENFRYFLADSPQGTSSSDIYGVQLTGGNAVLTYLATTDYQAHLAFDEAAKQLYMVNRNNGSFEILDINSLEVNGPVVLSSSLPNVASAVFSADGNLLLGDESSNDVFVVNVVTGNRTQLSGESLTSINGGDLVYGADGTLYYASRPSDGKLFDVLTNTIVGNMPTEVTGAALMPSGNLLTSSRGFDDLRVYGPTGSATELAIWPTVDVNGFPIIVKPVDLAGGCTDGGNQPGVENGECYATEVLEYLQGVRQNGSAIQVNRTDSSEALGMPERTDDFVFVALGYNGSITLAFNGSVPNGPGNDIEIVETTFNFSSVANYPEFADVYVSIDGVSFDLAGTVDHENRFINIDAVDPNIEYINYVRIVNNNALSGTEDGFDLDGVVAIHNCEVVPPANPFNSIESQSELSSFPNPTQGQSRVVFTTGESSRTVLEVYDMNGRNVGSLFNQETQKGKEYTIDFNGNQLPNGVYIYRLTTNNETIIEKFMIAR